MSAQIITSPSGERLVVLSEAEYERLREAAETADDIHAFDEAMRKLASGEEEMLPAVMVKRILEGENPVRVWREHRGLSVRALARKAGLTQAFLSQIETGKRAGSVATMKKIAAALGIGLDDLVG